jgi:hypothetical protein
MLDLPHGPPPRQRRHINLLRGDSADTTPSMAAPAPSAVEVSPAPPDRRRRHRHAVASSGRCRHQIAGSPTAIERRGSPAPPLLPPPRRCEAAGRAGDSCSATPSYSPRRRPLNLEQRSRAPLQRREDQGRTAAADQPSTHPFVR